MLAFFCATLPPVTSGGPAKFGPSNCHGKQKSSGEFKPRLFVSALLEDKDETSRLTAELQLALSTDVTVEERKQIFWSFCRSNALSIKADAEEDLRVSWNEGFQV